MTLHNTRPGELGELVSLSLRQSLIKVTGMAPIAGYVERESALHWDSVAQAGWDLVGTAIDDESATLRDLSEIAQVWGEFSVPLPLIPSIIAKRHSAAAAEHDGPVTFGIHTQTVAPGTSMAVFGQWKDIAIAISLGEQNAGLRSVDGPVASDFAPTLLSAEIPFSTAISAAAAAEIAVLWASEASGISTRAVREAVAYAKQREQFGKPIGSFQAIKHHLANAHTAAEQAQTGAIWGSLDTDNALRCSLHSFNSSIKAIELAIQVHGGLGFTWEMGIHFYLRHVVALRELVSGLRPTA